MRGREGERKRKESKREVRVMQMESAEVEEKAMRVRLGEMRKSSDQLMKSMTT